MDLQHLCKAAIEAWASINDVSFDDAKKRYVESDVVQKQVFMLAAWGAASLTVDEINKIKAAR